MNQGDIFRLLLIVLLMANSQLGRENNNDECNDNDSEFSYQRINEFLIFTMVLSPFSTGTETSNNTTF
ncbi:MAG: hypothetical protein IKC64_00670 [Clostridia bacterium]|nr:hypothetical protein [Clostridia bacterium]